ncbi:hypothetical protein VE01_06213 [Pseudogymnoascus verrucosus]|uniref:Programmed cell death protein 2 C-terminal domain-containing protein n=1 Tax=Pseudogymnoascus verrucosus TaxID=342668 RepID=A0A1B8GFY9_9PEZI|nr:uncharacterized protein VE01_06213 [Pseudogymnoascus verrucosus]OBT94744.1 hypothetical protein VE01_06213 [Pseudogymnoascus verrucosus]
MGNYDSDSSDGGEQDYTETNVLLGYASKEASESDDVNSYIGGRPTWLSPTTPPSASLARCKICSDMLILLLQLNGDLPKDFPGHERRLYVLTCRRKTCRRKEGSIRVLRSLRVSEAAAAKEVQKKEEVKPAPKPAAGQGKVVSNTMFGDSLFGSKSTGGGAFGGNPFSSPGGVGGANPFSTAAPAAAAANPFATSELAAKPPQKPDADLPQTFAAALSLNAPAPSPPTPAEPWPVDAELPAPYPLFYLADADYETLDKDEPEPIQKHEMLEMEVEGPSGSSGGKEDKDVYESSIDTTFQKFADRLSQNPEQVIRYEFKGSPLLYTKSDAVGKLLGGGSGSSNAKVTVGGGKMPRCANCGAGRCFEVQLTPHAITELESEEVSLEGMEWGTVIVGVCERDCQARGVEAGEVGYLEEWAAVQWEEVPDKMKG